MNSNSTNNDEKKEEQLTSNSQELMADAVEEQCSAINDTENPEKESTIMNNKILEEQANIVNANEHESSNATLKEESENISAENNSDEVVASINENIILNSELENPAEEKTPETTILIESNKTEENVIVQKEVNPELAYSFSSYVLTFLLLIIATVVYSLPSFMPYIQGEINPLHSEAEFMHAFSHMQATPLTLFSFPDIFGYSLNNFFAGISQDFSLSFLAPSVVEGRIIDLFPLPFYFASILAKIPYITSDNLVLVAQAVSLLLFVISVYLLAVSMRFSSKIAFSASLIALMASVFYSFMQFDSVIFIDYLFAFFINISLICFYRAWHKESAPFTLILAFIFVALGFFTKGGMAFFLPVLLSVFFLLFHGHFRRINDRDGIVGLLVFILLLGVWFGILYNSEAKEYLLSIFDFSLFTRPWVEWFSVLNFLDYLCAFGVMFIFFLAVPFFANWKMYLTGIRKNYKLFTYSAYKRIADNKEREFQVESADKEESNTKSRNEVRIFLQASGTLFLYLNFIISLLILAFFGNVDLSYIVLLITAPSILFAKSFINFSAKSSKFYGLLLAILFIVLAILSAPAYFINEIENMFPDVIAKLPVDLFYYYQAVPNLSLVAIPLSISAALLFYIKKDCSYKVLNFFTLLFAFIVIFCSYFVLPQVKDYRYLLHISNEEFFDATEYDDEPEIVEEIEKPIEENSEPLSETIDEPLAPQVEMPVEEIVEQEASDLLEQPVEEFLEEPAKPLVEEQATESTEQEVENDIATESTDEETTNTTGEVIL